MLFLQGRKLAVFGHLSPKEKNLACDKYPFRNRTKTYQFYNAIQDCHKTPSKLEHDCRAVPPWTSDCHLQRNYEQQSTVGT